jgi:hypothetical protein
MACELVSCGPYVTLGEQKAAKELQEQLHATSDCWILLTNVTPATQTSSREIDIIGVGLTGVTAIDVKSFVGRVTGDATRWMLLGGDGRLDPIGAIDAAAKVPPLPSSTTKGSAEGRGSDSLDCRGHPAGCR